MKRKVLKMVKAIADEHGCKVKTRKDGNIQVDCPHNTKIPCATALRNKLGNCVSQGGQNG